MPTARELLEQADALMRRNREATAAPPPPVLHASPMPAPGTLRTARELQHEPLRDALGPSSRAPSPPPPVTSASDDTAFPDGVGEPVARASPSTPTVLAPPAPSPSPVEADFPVLTDSVEELQVSLAPVPVLALPPAPPDAEDVPVLTDAVETVEISEPAPVEADDQGAPSFWLDHEPHESSVLGPPNGFGFSHEPPSAEAELDAEIVAAAMRGNVADADDARPAWSPASFESTGRSARPGAEPETRSGAAATPASTDHGATAIHDPLGLDGAYAEPSAFAPTPVETSPVAPAAVEPAAPPIAADADTEPPLSMAATTTAAAFAASASTATVTTAPASTAPASTGNTPADPEPPRPSRHDADASAPPVPEARVDAAPDDRERWDALAEEIRMQVLQRIDLFTDTGLREQLGERLKPIVDRASAELVATINQHVGELLRAYVAEAIEREIEKWRNG